MSGEKPAASGGNGEISISGGGAGGGGRGEASISLGVGGGGGVNVPAAPERTDPYYPAHPDGPIPVDLGLRDVMPDDQPDGESWILTAAGNVLLCSSIGSRMSLENVAGTSGYLDSLDLAMAPPEQRTAILAGVRAWLARQEATGGA